MNNKLKISLNDVLLVLIALIPIAVALLHYSKIPSQLITHYEFSGGVNRLLQKKVALTLMSLMTLGFPILFKTTRSLNSNQANPFKFEPFFELMRISISILLSYLFLLTILFNLGHYLGFTNWGIPLVGIFFIFYGNVLNRLRFNYPLGIHTPWTLSNEDIWRRTHRFSGPVFIVAGLLMMLSIALKNPYWVILAILIIIVLIPTGYSYLINRQINRTT